VQVADPQLQVIPLTEAVFDGEDLSLVKFFGGRVSFDGAEFSGDGALFKGTEFSDSIVRAARQRRNSR
jgi:uncharacterized protein YjbI with pentapeptide repeats